MSNLFFYRKDLSRIILSIKKSYIYMIYLICFSQSNYVIGQNCGFVSDGNSVPVTEDFHGQEFQINVVFHFVRDGNCQGGRPTSIVTAYMNELNSVYQSSGISFNLLCIKEICSQLYVNNSNFNLDFPNVQKLYSSDDVINIYILYDLTPPGNGSGSGNQAGTSCWVLNTTDKNLLSHEVGHVLNLIHTYDQVTYGKSCFGDDNSLYNKGDLVYDTPPDPNWLGEIINLSDCTFDFSKCPGSYCIDACGNPHQGFDPKIMMSSYDYCTEYFTEGQANRMKYKIKNGTNDNTFNSPNIDLIVENYQAIKTPLRINKEIVIKNGGTLEVESTLYMPAASRIIIEPGGILKITGGKITLGKVKNICNERIGDGRFWRGIELNTQNNSNSPQVIINGGTIELSELGVHLKSNATLGNYTVHISNNSIFKNNKHSIYLFRNPIGSANSILISNSTFYITTSTSGGAAPFPLSNYYSQIYADNASISINKCIFSNPNNLPPIDDLSYAVRVMNTNLIVTGDLNTPTLFKDDIYGISVSSFMGTKSFRSSFCKFDKVKIGIRVNAGVNNYVVRNNTFFKVRQTGLISNHCTGYAISNNLFDNGADNLPNYVGILMEESGGSSNIIDNNIFRTNNQLANKAIGLNGSDFSGLQYRCNKTYSSSIDYLLDGSVSKFQGEISNAAGNESYNGNNEIKFSLNNLTHNLTYYYINVPSEIPQYHIKIIRKEVSQKDCTSPRMTIGDQRDDRRRIGVGMLQPKVELYNISIDNGNASNLLNLIEAATTLNSNSIYQQLLNISPWISPKVVQAFYFNSTIFSPEQRFQILLQNPDNFGTPGFTNSLHGLPNSLSDSLFHLLDSLVLYNTARTTLESEISGIQQYIDGICHEAIEYYKDSEHYDLDSLIAWIHRSGSYKSFRELIDLRAEQRDYSGAVAELININNNLAMPISEQSDQQYFSDLLYTANTAQQNNRYEGKLDSAGLLSLTQIASLGNYQTAKEAQSVLDFYYQSNNIQALTHNYANDINLNVNQQLLPIISSDNSVTIFPNPVNDFLTIEFKGDKYNNGNNLICIYDLFARKKLEHAFSESTVNINVSGLNSGIYILSLKNSNEEVKNFKIRIIK